MTLGCVLILRSNPPGEPALHACATLPPLGLSLTGGRVWPVICLSSQRQAFGHLHHSLSAAGSVDCFIRVELCRGHTEREARLNAEQNDTPRVDLSGRLARCAAIGAMLALYWRREHPVFFESTCVEKHPWKSLITKFRMFFQPLQP
ncbi:hypothetical protein C8Q73DRAFT_713301 [Cubamyces lactineus]|nr:hypothetical protein C8Q73DRAFT_713301 [Cubamyces lactineus]